MSQQKNSRFLLNWSNTFHEHGKLPVVNFAAGGVATPADAALMMQLGAEGVLLDQVFSSQEILLNEQVLLLRRNQLQKSSNSSSNL